jgi:hypothetical protein
VSLIYVLGVARILLKSDVNYVTSQNPMEPVVRLNDEQQLILKQMDAIFMEHRQKLLYQISSLEEELDKYEHAKMIPNRPMNFSIQPRLSHMKNRERLERYKTLFHGNTHLMTSGIRYSSEYEMAPYESHNGTHLMSSMVDMGIGQIVEMVGRRAAALQEVTATSRNALKTQTEVNTTVNNMDTNSSFFHGLYKFTHGIGEKYDMFFKPNQHRKIGQCTGPHLMTKHSKRRVGSANNYTNCHLHSSDNVTKVTLARPCGPLQLTRIATVTGVVHINIILPLSSDRLSMLNQFISRLDYPAETHTTLSLTIVYFGKEDKRMITRLFPATTLPIYIVMLNEPTNHMDGLRTGANSRIGRAEVLLLLANVDLVITEDGLRRCRYHTTLGQMVYYPMVFSLYDPHLIYEVIHKETIPSVQNQLRIDHDKGRWQQNHYGVSCQYRTDFLAMSNDLGLDTWQDADQTLYTKYIQSVYKINRAPDHGFFQLYHPRHCAAVSQERFKQCMLRKAYSAGSHTQLGFVVFKNEIAFTKTH